MTASFTMDEITERLKSLRPGKEFQVRSATERQYALRAALELGKRVVTRARKSGGFTITVLHAE